MHVHLCLCLRTAFSYVLPIFPKFSLKIVLVSMSYFPSHNIAMNIEWGWLFNKCLANTFLPVNLLAWYLSSSCCSSYKICLLSVGCPVGRGSLMPTTCRSKCQSRYLSPYWWGRGYSHTRRGEPSSGAYCRENVFLVNLLPESDEKKTEKPREKDKEDADGDMPPPAGPCSPWPGIHTPPWLRKNFGVLTSTLSTGVPSGCRVSLLSSLPWSQRVEIGAKKSKLGWPHS